MDGGRRLDKTAGKKIRWGGENYFSSLSSKAALNTDGAHTPLPHRKSGKREFEKRNFAPAVSSLSEEEKKSFRQSEEEEEADLFSDSGGREENCRKGGRQGERMTRTHSPSSLFVRPSPKKNCF